MINPLAPHCRARDEPASDAQVYLRKMSQSEAVLSEDIGVVDPPGVGSGIQWGERQDEN